MQGAKQIDCTGCQGLVPAEQLTTVPKMKMQNGAVYICTFHLRDVEVTWEIIPPYSFPLTLHIVLLGPLICFVRHQR